MIFLIPPSSLSHANDMFNHKLSKLKPNEIQLSSIV